MAGAFLRSGTPRQAQPYARQAYAISLADHDSLGMWDGAARLGIIALRSGQLETARTYFRQLVLLARRNRTPHRLPEAFGKLAQEQLHRPDSARYYHTLAYRLGAAQQSSSLGLLLADAAGFEQRQRRYAPAEALAHRALNLDGGRPNGLYSPKAWQVLRAVAESRGDFAAAYRLLRQEQDYEAAHQRRQSQRLTETLRISYISYETEQTRQQVLLRPGSGVCRSPWGRSQHPAPARPAGPLPYL